ncbi:LytTR family transcriptional regulator DNA-binding domain-containing protein [Cohnella abietis]|nr:LytTR family transcriptional regulator DNA-binding domain-containing protein [Cohnella abietis]
MIGIKLDGRTGEESDIVEFRLSEVNYITVRRATKHNLQIPIYHTQSDALLPLRTIGEMTRAYVQYGFIAADKSNIVNTRRIKKMIQERKGSYIEFIDGTTIQISNRRK